MNTESCGHQLSFKYVTIFTVFKCSGIAWGCSKSECFFLRDSLILISKPEQSLQLNECDKKRQESHDSIEAAKKQARPKISNGNTVDLSDENNVVGSQDNGNQINAQEIQATAEQKIPRERPKVPLRTKNKPERKENDSPEQKLHSPGHKPERATSPDTASPVADATKDSHSVVQAKGRDGKILRPKVPPKPLYPPQ